MTALTDAKGEFSLENVPIGKDVPVVIQIGKWRREHAKYAAQAFAGNGHRYKEEARSADLERMVGRLTMENAFLKKALSHLEAQQHGRTDKRGR